MNILSMENINSDGILPVGMLQVWSENDLGRTLDLNQSKS